MSGKYRLGLAFLVAYFGTVAENQLDFKHRTVNPTIDYVMFIFWRVVAANQERAPTNVRGTEMLEILVF
ncbi:hypothetical protein A0H81_14841 [Grifola frondosa]|uniref:Secreted protein n=1 Tax=Grifola frondosa TaxID=5627 RepID=A0A1C7LQY4_GRIFR|nr:hypothetical protein A0H81_14841 [Grifola frondosa]